MAFAYTIYAVAAFALFFVVPGMVLVRLASRDTYVRSFYAVSFGVGTCVVAYLSLLVAGLVGLVFRFHLSFGMVAAVSLALTLGGVAAIRLREGSFKFLPDVFARKVRENFNLPLFLFLALAVVVYLLGYDSTVYDQERCVSRAGILPFHDYLSKDPPLGFPGCLDCFTNRNAFLLWNGGQRMGPSVFVANFLAVFRFPGFRILHAFFGLMTAWFGWHLGRSLFNRTSLAYLTAALLVFNPYALSIPLLDENVMSLAIGTALFYTVLAKRTQWLFAGLFLGIFLGIRHIGILSIPAIVAAAWLNSTTQHYQAKWVDEYFGSGKVANISILILSTVVFSVPWILVHTQGYWAGREVYEAFVSMPETRHSFLGMDFSTRALLSWPFVDAPVRSPYNGFPTLLSFPLTILRTWGIVLLSLIPVGLIWGWNRRRPAVVLGLLWFPIQLAMLSVMANWVQPNKMGVFLCFSQPIVLAIVAGVAVMLRVRISEPRKLMKPLAIAGVAVVLMSVFQLAVAGYDAELDERNFEARVDYILEDYPVVPPMIRHTEEKHAVLDRQHLSSLSLLPDFSLARHLHVSHLLGFRLRQIGKDFSRPGLAEFCERPKDLLHGLLGITAPPVQQPGKHDQLDLRKGEFPTLQDMMHRPVSSIRDEAGGKWGGCFQPASSPGPIVELTMDLSRPLIDNAQFLDSAVSGNGVDAPASLADGTIRVVPNIQVPWADGGPCHLAVVPVWHDYYWLVLWYGDFLFGHLAARTDVQVIKPGDSQRFSFAFPEGALLRVTEVSSLEPTRFHVWTAQVGDDMNLSGPIASSY